MCSELPFDIGTMIKCDVNLPNGSYSDDYQAILIVTLFSTSYVLFVQAFLSVFV